MSKHHQMNADQFPESQEELKRLMERGLKYVNYCIDHKGKRKTKALSLAIMISLERVRAVNEFQRQHKHRTMSRWDHFMAIFDSRRIYK